MSMQDPVADMLTCIRNAQAVGEMKMRTPHSLLKKAVLHVLQSEGYIEGFDVVTAGVKKDIEVMLKYYQGRPVIEKLKRISRPGLRVYRRCDELPVVRGGMGIAVISTSKGVMADKEARRQRMGGEILCTVE
ncbi:MAG: 30S ribosomal protein S8 [Gammaproteobacteria bacterium RIFCSPHIGHO2_12_FULL_41_20]|nr:MAG: 30S ribosomal protein S8 [Gammaproteobacteria bacterium RIFCSPHIGHO2_12_FULL_41_20]